MHTARIAELLDPFLRAPIPDQAEADALSTAQLERISTYIDILIRWNARINLTAIRDPEDIVTRHFGESLFAARSLFPSTTHVATGAPPVDPKRSEAAMKNSKALDLEKERGAAPKANDQRPTTDDRRPTTNDQRPTTNDRLTVADLGSGAGFPGLPIKIWAPHISLTLIESNQKKSTFLREVARSLTLTGVDIQNARAESLPTRAYDMVTLRAVERFESILPTAASLVAPAGRLALLISSAQQSQAQAALPNLTWSEPSLVPNSRARILLIAKTR